MKNLLNESFKNKLLKYSLVAGAVLVGTESANAQVWSTTVNQTLTGNNSLSITFNGNKRFKIIHRTIAPDSAFISNSVQIEHSTVNGGWIKRNTNSAKALSTSYVISNGKSFANISGYQNIARETFSGITTSGTSFINQTKYIGVKFNLTDGTHYGWIKITIPSGIGSVTVVSYAYEQTPGLGIKAGSTTALPVELTTFTANNIGDKVELKWQTSTEVNCYGFDIERSQMTEVSSQSSTVNRHSSINNRQWQKVGFVKGAGTSNSPKSYSFIDKNPVAGKAEYRLKQIDNDGSFKYSKIVGASFMKPAEFTLYQNYPNPFNPSTNLRYSIPFNSHVVLTIYNTLGQRVKVLIDKIQSAGYYNYQWNANEMASGVYIYVLDAVSTNGQKNYQSIKKMVLLK